MDELAIFVNLVQLLRVYVEIITIQQLTQQRNHDKVM
ncbi:hypothetical protein SAMN05421730_101282 [Anaerobium acetethylicum]|uniref:Uncharacterized protein n=1 Tax=Anaerobium acetethylicum TaxID=1619234 RepID=A0A1D3TUG4_9FIRM|nr:hypothetical protein SAMN05421730_101282 [Anaerobium acetethylicum]